jgi:hypothetical protein
VFKKIIYFARGFSFTFLSYVAGYSMFALLSDYDLGKTDLTFTLTMGFIFGLCWIVGRLVRKDYKI